MRPRLIVCILLLQTCSGLPGLSSYGPSGAEFGSFDPGYHTFDARLFPAYPEFGSVATELRYPDIGFNTPHSGPRLPDTGLRPLSGFTSPVPGHGTSDRGLGISAIDRGFRYRDQMEFGPDYSPQRELRSGRRADSNYFIRTPPPYDTRIDTGSQNSEFRYPQTTNDNFLTRRSETARTDSSRRHSRRVARRLRPRTHISRRRRPLEQRLERDILSSLRPGSRRNRTPVSQISGSQRSDSQISGSQISDIQSSGRQRSMSRGSGSQSPDSGRFFREGQIGAYGGENGFPFFGGYCAHEPCNDGGQRAGVGNGIGTGSLEAFERRRQSGENENLRLVEMFVSRRETQAV